MSAELDMRITAGKLQLEVIMRDAGPVLVVRLDNDDKLVQATVMGVAAGAAIYSIGRPWRSFLNYTFGEKSAEICLLLDSGSAEETRMDALGSLRQLATSSSNQAALVNLANDDVASLVSMEYGGRHVRPG